MRAVRDSSPHSLVTKFTIQAHSSSVLMLATTASCSAYTASTPRRSNHEAIHSINIGPVITASAARVTGAGSVITRQLVRGARAVLTAFLTTSSQPDHTAARRSTGRAPRAGMERTASTSRLHRERRASYVRAGRLHAGLVTAVQCLVASWCAGLILFRPLPSLRCSSAAPGLYPQSRRPQSRRLARTTNRLLQRRQERHPLPPSQTSEPQRSSNGASAR